MNPLNPVRFDRQALTQLFTQSFVAPANAESRTIAAFGEQNVRVLQADGELIGGLVFLPLRQWYGGQPVTMTGIGSVAIAPHHRGKGESSKLLRRSLEELQDAGIALSVLYPATQGLYRKWGYEVAGSWVRWQLDCANLPRWQPCLDIAPIPLTPEAIQPIYDRYAPLHNGHLDRSAGVWRLLQQSADAYAYRLGSAADPQGYLIYQQDRTEAGTQISLRDWVTLSPAALQTSWAFLAQHQLQVDTLVWQGSPVDSRLVLLPEQTAKVKRHRSWMIRILNVEAALTQRGYGMDLDRELHFQVTDSLFAANNDRFCLQVSQGRGHIHRGGRGELRLSIGALAPLFSGFLTPLQLQQLGYLDGDDRSLTIAQAMFQGHHPWMVDFF